MYYGHHTCNTATLHVLWLETCVNGYNTCFASWRTCSSRKAMLNKIVVENTSQHANVFARVVTLAFNYSRCETRPQCVLGCSAYVYYGRSSTCANGHSTLIMRLSGLTTGGRRRHASAVLASPAVPAALSQG